MNIWQDFATVLSASINSCIQCVMIEEAQIWPRDILERFLVTGERPRWTSDPGL